MATNKDVDLHEENGSVLVATAITLLSLSWFSVGLRTYTRAVLMKSLQVDDWLMLVAQAIFTVSCAFIIEGVQQGIGKHNDAIKTDEAKVQALMWQALATATYILDMMFIKLSIGVFLLRLCVERVYNWIIWISLAIISIWSIVLFFWNLFQCKPVEMQWDFRITNGTCVNANQIVSAAYAISVMTVVSDWLYALLPIPMLWSVRMTKQAKATVIVILGLGIFVATLVRLRFLADLTDTEDILFAGTDAMVWTLIEPGVAIVASSLATIRPLLRAMRIRGFESSENTYGTGHSVAVRSNANRNKTGILVMPGFGPDDVSLTNMVSPNNTGPLSRQSDIEVLPPRNLDDGPKSPGQASVVKSEILVIQGNGSPPSSLQSRNDRSASSSFDQIHDLEAHSQELERDNIGGRRR
ncbi:integral membrane protein pth11 [Fusarium beomiforme]|uniref:Integral membrane protein pth11 n=1 Tax=Fusarium beomiforme TaxID=44412 RepID=A0A9P5AHR4_9HYPO|nr:integral membrane protein pth11 [Fusarium beomiforme]